MNKDKTWYQLGKKQNKKQFAIKKKDQTKQLSMATSYIGSNGSWQ